MASRLTTGPTNTTGLHGNHVYRWLGEGMTSCTESAACGARGTGGGPRRLSCPLCPRPLCPLNLRGHT